MFSLNALPPKKMNSASFSDVPISVYFGTRCCSSILRRYLFDYTAPSYKEYLQEIDAPNHNKRMLLYPYNEFTFRQMQMHGYKDCIRIAVVRDPVKRFVSAFNRIKTYPFPGCDWHTSFTVDDVFTCAHIRRDLHFFPQTFFAGHNPRVFDYCWNMETTPDIEAKFTEIFGIPNEGKHRNLNTVIGLHTDDLSSRQVSLIKQAYAADYKFLEYL